MQKWLLHSVKNVEVKVRGEYCLMQGGELKHHSVHLWVTSGRCVTSTTGLIRMLSYVTDLWWDDNGCHSASDIFSWVQSSLAPLNHHHTQQLLFICSVHSESPFNNHARTAHIPHAADGCLDHLAPDWRQIQDSPQLSLCHRQWSGQASLTLGIWNAHLSEHRHFVLLDPGLSTA